MSGALGNRLTKNKKRLRSWALKAGVTCFRIYDRDLPDVPMALDLYEDAGDGCLWLHASVFEPRHGVDHKTVGRWIEEASEALAIPAVRTVVKRRSPGAAYEKEGESGARFTVNEGGLKFSVNLVDYLDTGLFLDHRITRARVKEESAGKRVLNLFAYTGAFSVYAAAGGASRTVSVDLSPTYARWAEDNLALNGFGGVNHGNSHVVDVADVMAWLGKSRETFDLVVIDPPTVSKSKRADSFEVQRDHVRLIEGALARLSDHGVAYFSTNFQGFVLQAPKNVFVDEITAETVPADFPRRPPIHRAWRFDRSKK